MATRNGTVPVTVPDWLWACGPGKARSKTAVEITKKTTRALTMYLVNLTRPLLFNCQSKLCFTIDLLHIGFTKGATYSLRLLSRWSSSNQALPQVFVEKFESTGPSQFRCRL